MLDSSVMCKYFNIGKYISSSVNFEGHCKLQCYYKIDAR